MSISGLQPPVAAIDAEARTRAAPSPRPSPGQLANLGRLNPSMGACANHCIEASCVVAFGVKKASCGLVRFPRWRMNATSHAVALQAVRRCIALFPGRSLTSALSCCI
jgi:hypothetical protein